MAKASCSRINILAGRGDFPPLIVSLGMSERIYVFGSLLLGGLHYSAYGRGLAAIAVVAIVYGLSWVAQLLSYVGTTPDEE